MIKFHKLLLALILTIISPMFFNPFCFGKSINKSNNAYLEKTKKNKVKQIEYKIHKISDKKTQVDIIMYIPCKKQKIDSNNVEILDLQSGKISNLSKKISTVHINKKSYIKIELSYIVEIKNKTEKEFVWPVPGYKTITSGFNDKEKRTHIHGAIDISGKGIYDAKVVASGEGKVIVANTDSWGGGYGKYVVIDHGDGENTLYGHMSKVTVKTGESVSAGQKIGNVGNTGLSECPHLHFEYRINGVRTNPACILDI